MTSRKVHGLGVRVGLGFRDKGLDLRVTGLGVRRGFRVLGGLGFRGYG